jgi:hypothetical protein
MFSTGKALANCPNWLLAGENLPEEHRNKADCGGQIFSRDYAGFLALYWRSQ